MIFGLPIELLIFLLLFGLVLAFYIGVISSNYKKYAVAEELSGSLLMELEPSKKTQFYRKAELVIGITLYMAICLKRFLVDGIGMTFEFILLAGVIAMSHLNNKNQKICEKGILVSVGLVTWDNIQSIEPVNEMDDKINILLKKRFKGCKKIPLYCTPGEALNIVHMIESRMVENSVF